MWVVKYLGICYWGLGRDYPQSQPPTDCSFEKWFSVKLIQIILKPSQVVHYLQVVGLSWKHWATALGFCLFCPELELLEDWFVPVD